MNGFYNTIDILSCSHCVNLAFSHSIILKVSHVLTDLLVISQKTWVLVNFHIVFKVRKMSARV